MKKESKQSLNNRIKDYLIQTGKDRTYREIGEFFGVPGEAVRSLHRTLKSHQPEEEPILPTDGEVVSYKEDLNKGIAEKTVSFKDEIRTLDELIKKCNIDTSVWNIDKYIQNFWGGNYQVKAYLSKIKEEEKDMKHFLNYLENYTPSHKTLSKKDILLNTSFERKSCAFIDITDFHLDKLTIEAETLEDRIDTFYSIVNRLLYRVYQSFFIDEIVFIVGSDWFHTDTFNNTTTKGTPVESLTSWDNSYELGFDIYATVISKLKQFCNKLNVVLVQGNHDRTKSFYLAHALSKYFEEEDSIIFDIKACNRKIYTYGNTFIGLHHGNCKIDELPLVFAKEFAPQWGNCKYHEVKVGDKHFYMEKEIKGVRIKQLPSLSATDQWHDDSNFVQNIRCGIVTVYDKEKGKVAEYEERI